MLYALCPKTNSTNKIYPVKFFEEDKRSLPRETGLFLFNWGEFHQGQYNQSN
jgi:hypothetical protein